MLAPECSNLSFADYKLLRNQFAGNIKFVPNALPEILAGRHVCLDRGLGILSRAPFNIHISTPLFPRNKF